MNSAAKGKDREADMDDEQDTQEAPAQETPRNPPPESREQDVVLELNFVPDWARKPPAPKYTEHEGGSEDRRRDRWQDRRGGGGGSRPPHDRNARPRTDRPAGPPRGDGRRDERRRNDAPVRGDRDFRPRDRRDTYYEPAPFFVQFLPEQRQLIAMIRQIRSSRRCYPLMHLGAIFINNADFCLARLEPDPDAGEFRFHQCKVCKTAALDHATLVRHIAKAHLDDYFEKQEATVEPPAGQFTCVAQCGLTGTLLGPPNHHSYGDKIKEIHAARYPQMPLDEYRSRIKMLHDPQLIEQWKQESTRQVVYRLKGAPEGENPMKWADAEAHIAQTLAPTLIAESHRVVVPAGIALRGEDPVISRAIREALIREARFPFKLSLALRAAFRHMALHMFKAGGNITFVTAILPDPLNPEFVVENIREVLTFLRERPGCTREQLVEALRPGTAPDSPEAKAVLQPLGWLIEKGHIIEFFNATLSVPLVSRPVKPATAAPKAPPATDATAAPATTTPAPEATPPATPPPAEAPAKE